MIAFFSTIPISRMIPIRRDHRRNRSGNNINESSAPTPAEG